MMIIDDQKKIKLKTSEFNIFKELMKNPNKAISRSDLLKTANINCKNYINIIIFNLRKKLKDLINIIAVEGIGYKYKP